MTQKPMTGRVSLFRGKVRGQPLSVLLTPRHWTLIDDAARRLVISRSDVVALLLHRYSRTVEIPARFRADD